MVSSSPDATGNSCQDSTVGIDALKQLPGIVVLPTVGTPTSVSQRHEVNPLMALKLLQDIQSTVSLWQEQLRQIVQSLRSLEAQGPMVDGWLESSAETAHTTSAHANSQATLFRHGDADTLMRYVDSLDSTAQEEALQADTVTPSKTTVASSRQPSSTQEHPTQYRLCQLDANGHMRSHICPAEQLGVISMAIARHQKYKQLLLQKQAIESKLQRAVSQLTNVRTDLQGE